MALFAHQPSAPNNHVVAESIEVCPARPPPCWQPILRSPVSPALLRRRGPNRPRPRSPTDHVVPQVVLWSEVASVTLHKPAGFDLHVRGGRVVSLRADTPEGRNEWVAAVLRLASMRAAQLLEQALSPEWELVCVDAAGRDEWEYGRYVGGAR